MPEDRLDDQALVLVLDDHLHLELRADVDRQARAAVGLDDATLPPRALDLADRQRRKAPLEQLGPDRLERLVTDVCLDLLHVHLLTWRPRWRVRRWPAARRGAGRSLRPDIPAAG